MDAINVKNRKIVLLDQVVAEGRKIKRQAAKVRKRYCGPDLYVRHNRKQQGSCSPLEHRLECRRFAEDDLF